MIVHTLPPLVSFFVLLIITSLSLANNSVDGVEFVHILRYRTHECNRNIRISSSEIGILYQSVIWYRNDVMLSNCIWLFKKDYLLDSLSYLLKNNPWTYATTGRKFGHSCERLRQIALCPVCSAEQTVAKLKQKILELDIAILMTLSRATYNCKTNLFSQRQCIVFGVVFSLSPRTECIM